MELIVQYLACTSWFNRKQFFIILKVPQTVQEDQEPLPEMGQPLKFDLSQPTSKHNLDSTIGNDFPMISSDMSLLFDMSPPSLLSSLTFSNIMDSSFIKNDAVLSKIRDKDYTETVLLQDFEAPMFQSISESCSSLNSDTPENFLRKVTRENNYVTITPDRVLSLASSIPSGEYFFARTKTKLSDYVGISDIFIDYPIKRWVPNNCSWDGFINASLVLCVWRL